MPAEAENTNTAAASTTATGEQSSQQSQQTGAQDASTSSSGEASGAPAGSPAGAAASGAAERPKSALDAVLKVLKKPAAADAAAATGDQAATTAAKGGEQQVDDKEHQAAGEGEKDWISKDEYAKLPPVVRRRIGRLTGERNDAREQMKVMQPRAKTYDDLHTYCNEHKLTADDFSFGLAVMAEIRSGNPAKAWEMLQPVIRDLQGHVGDILPADLAKEVDDGKLSEDRAKELAAARRDRDRLQRQGEQRGEEQRRADAERATTETHTKITDSIKGWEANWKSSDPDYPKKSERVWERMVVLMNAETKALSPARAVELAEQARKDVEGWLAGLLPKKQEVRPGPQGGTGAGVVKKPSSALEAARMAVQTP